MKILFLLTGKKKYCGKEEKFSPLFHNIFNISLTSRFQLHTYLLNVVVWIIFSSILQIWYVEVRISRSISASPLEFEIRRFDCISENLLTFMKWAFSVNQKSQQNHHKNIPIYFDPLKPHFYIVKLGFTGVYIIFLISDQKHRLWVLVRTASFEQKYEKYQNLLSEFFHFLVLKFSIYLNRHVFVMMENNIDPNETGSWWAVSSGSTMLARVSGLVCRAESVKEHLMIILG